MSLGVGLGLFAPEVARANLIEKTTDTAYVAGGPYTLLTLTITDGQVGEVVDAIGMMRWVTANFNVVGTFTLKLNGAAIGRTITTDANNGLSLFFALDGRGTLTSGTNTIILELTTASTTLSFDCATNVRCECILSYRRFKA